MLSAICLLIVASCSKSNNEPEQLKTPLHSIMDSKYINIIPDQYLEVYFNSYSNGGDLDKKTFDAATATVNAPYNY